MNKEYFVINHNQMIGLREKHYREIFTQLPFHTVNISSDYAIISFECPFTSWGATKQYFYFGKRMDPSQYKEKIKPSPYPLSIETSSDSVGIYDVNESLPTSFNPCELCEREMQCLFSSKNLSFKPKNSNNSEVFIRILEENGYAESKLLYHKYVAHYESQGYNDVGPQTLGELIVLLVLFIPLFIFFLPWLIISSFTDRRKNKRR